MNFDPVLMKWVERRCGVNSGGTGGGTGGDSTGEEWIGDGNTHIWFSVSEGRKNPRVCLAVNGTVTVDWGDGAAPTTLTGTSLTTVVNTARHTYDKAGEYVITLAVDGEFAIRGASSNSHLLADTLNTGYSSTKNAAYVGAIERIELGSNGVYLGDYAFCKCRSLKEIFIPEGVAGVSSTDSRYVFSNCSSLEAVHFPNSFASSFISSCTNCLALKSVRLPDSLLMTGSAMFQSCESLREINIPDGTMFIEDNSFNSCYSLSVVRFPAKVLEIGKGAFSNCYSMVCFDFSKHTAVPTLKDAAALVGSSSISSDCQVLVPAALANEWKAATNWSTYAAYIVGV